MPLIEFSTPTELPTPNGYSHVANIQPGHRLVWTSGQVALAADGTVIGPGDWEVQTRAVMRNLDVALDIAGANWSDVFKLTIYVIDTKSVPTVRAVRDEFIDLDRPPTSSLVKVAGLFRPDLLIEIEAVAAVPGADADRQPASRP